jgi:hypothetical protein
MQTIVEFVSILATRNTSQQSPNRTAFAVITINIERRFPVHGNEVFQRVCHALAQVEAERNVRVLFACESGSRAWGFASRDSDYDVRFLSVHRRDWYLSVEDRRDVIEQPIANDLDVSGWGCRRSRNHPGFDGVAWFRCARQGFARLAP